MSHKYVVRMFEQREDKIGKTHFEEHANVHGFEGLEDSLYERGYSIVDRSEHTIVGVRQVTSEAFQFCVCTWQKVY